jgi:zinc transport system permease protein
MGPGPVLAAQGLVVDLTPTWEQFWASFGTLYRDPIVTAAAAGALLGYLGVYVVTRRMVFISAALSQVSGAGVALAFFLPLAVGTDLGVIGEPILWALGLSLAATLFFRLDPARLGLTRDAILGLTYVLAGGVAVVIGSRIAQEAHDINAILFGTAVAVRPLDLWLTLGVGGGLLALHVLLLRGIAVATFDPVGARVQRLPVRALDAFLFVSVAVAVAVTTRALGALPVFAFTVLPAMGALALSRHLGRALLLAAGFGALSGAAGYGYSFFLRLPVGAAQATVAGVLCLAGLGVRLAADRDLRALRRALAGAATAAVLALAFVPLLAPADGEPEGAGAAHGHDGHHVIVIPAAAVTEEDVPRLIETLRAARDPLIRADAARALGHARSEVAREVLVAALGDADWSVRAEAAEALGHLGGPLPAPLLGALRGDESPWVRSAAAAALCHFEDPGAHEALHRAARDDAEQSVRDTANRHLRGCPNEH